MGKNKKIKKVYIETLTKMRNPFYTVLEAFFPALLIFYFIYCFPFETILLIGFLSIWFMCVGAIDFIKYKNEYLEFLKD